MAQANTTITSSHFLQQVLAKRPQLAVFDCDGTLWSGDAGADFFYWEIERGYIDPETVTWITQRYADYKRGIVDELTICGEMVQIHKGLDIGRIQEGAREFFRTVVAHRIFPAMLELTRQLALQGCEIWACSSTNDWVVEAGVEQFGIPADRILAAKVDVVEGRATDSLIRVPTDELKASAIQELIGRPVDAVFGNSMHDLHMLELARDPYAVNPNPELASIATERGWTVYWPETKEAKR